ncbi:MAG: hypothetical protein MI724_07475 [Spirochaetales bacterium]|nr:hypothetical protein [Spirochaetales bacterium]
MNEKIVVFATSFLDELVTHPAGEGEPARLLEEAARRNSLAIEFRCSRSPLQAMTAEEIEGAVAVIADLERWDAPVLAAVGRGNGGTLGLIARYGIGYDNVDIETARRSGITVTNTPGASARPTAEWAASTLLDVAGCRVPHHLRAARGERKQGPSRIDCTGKTLGVVGTGAIGKHVVSMLAGFDLRVIASDPHPDHEWARTAGVAYVDIMELCAQADFITLHASAKSPIIGTEEIGVMKSTTVLVNCARGVLVDNRAVYEAVRSGVLYGYGLDEVWDHPDLPLDPALNIAVSPHVGSDTDYGKLCMQRMSAEAVLHFLDGKELPHVVNEE